MMSFQTSRPVKEGQREPLRGQQSQCRSGRPCVRSGPSCGWNAPPSIEVSSGNGANTHFASTGAASKKTLVHDLTRAPAVAAFAGVVAWSKPWEALEAIISYKLQEHPLNCWVLQSADAKYTMDRLCESAIVRPPASFRFGRCGMQRCCLQ